MPGIVPVPAPQPLLFGPPGLARPLRRALLLQPGTGIPPRRFPLQDSRPPHTVQAATSRRPLFSILYADPPWSYRSWHADPDSARRRLPSSRGRVPPYACLSSEAIRALPVRDIAAPDCALFLWATYCHRH